MIARLLHLHGAAAAIFVFLALSSPSSSVHARAAVSAGGGCVASECEALISFKKSFVDPNGLLSSWRGEDCSSGWKGVRCDNGTGHVIKLDLRGPGYYFEEGDKLRGQIMNSTMIADLRHLRYLDLSCNDFDYGTREEPLLFLSTLKNLRYLNLSNAGFPFPGTSIPSQLGNLSRLQYLDLSYVDFLYGSDLRWLPHLSSLKVLDLSWQNLSSAMDWVRKVSMLTNLKILDLSYCQLNNDSNISHPSNSNLSHLEIFDLSGIPFNSFLQHSWFWDVTTIKELFLSYCGWSGTIPAALGNMSSLEVLYIDHNSISGTVPTTLENICNLQLISLEQNSIDGDILGRLPRCSWTKLRELHLQGANNLSAQLPDWIGNLTSLSYLDLSHNMMDGDVPSGIGALGNLNSLILGFNNFSGVLSEEHFASLVNLEYLDIRKTFLKFDFGEDWVPPFRLTLGYFGSSDMGPLFPAWLKWQTDILELDISDTNINDVLPRWFWVSFPNASVLDLSGNKLSGTLPPKLELPLVRSMDLSENSLSGHLPANLTAPNLDHLCLYKNNFTGTIPPYVCDGFQEINLSNNQLRGGFPRCQNNSSPTYLSMLDVRNNNLSGEFPHFLQYAGRLSFLDLSYNKFSGSVPIWVAEKMPRLLVLILRSNMFHGHLPMQLTRMVGLHYLDIAQNNISGIIPSSIARLSAMAEPYGDDDNYTSDSILTFIKGQELNYTHEFTKHIVLIDLSSNSFIGHIPKELSLLKGLRSLNLSNNQLSGPIPDDIGSLTKLESLDLSYNYLSGKIPSSLSDLTFLSCLNLSYNNLSGRIPSGQQLQTLNNQYMYIGNPGLCGPSLLKNCSINETNPTAVNEQHEGAISSFYISMNTGFMMGLWIVFCTMLFMKPWRTAYFQLLDQLYDKLYVQLAINKAAILRKFGNKEI